MTTTPTDRPGAPWFLPKLIVEAAREPGLYVACLSPEAGAWQFIFGRVRIGTATIPAADVKSLWIHLRPVDPETDPEDLLHLPRPVARERLSGVPPGGLDVRLGDIAWITRVETEDNAR